MTTSARALARRVPSEGPPLRISGGPAARSAKPRRDDVGGALGDAQRWSNRRRKACGGRRESGDAFFFRFTPFKVIDFLFWCKSPTWTVGCGIYG